MTKRILSVSMFFGCWIVCLQTADLIAATASGGETPVVNLVRQGFPAAKADPKDLEKSDTAWEIEWAITNPDNGYRPPQKTKKRRRNSRPSSVLAIRSAKFMYKDKFGKVRWITVLKNLELGEMFVPYDTTSPTFYDVARHSFYIIPAKKEYLGPNCVAPGEILASKDPRMNNKVMKEVHDDGLRWLNGRNNARRGEKMMLWAIFYGGNYRYLIEYDFSDDGTITCKIGATAHNYFDRQKDQRDVHLHAGCWRFDMHLSDPQSEIAGGPDQNVVRIVRRVPRPKQPGKFRIDVKPFNADENRVAREGAADWVAKEFTTLRIESTVRKNSNERPTAYDLMPLRYGSVRHYPESRDFINHDFWVTHADPNFKTYEKVPAYAKGNRPLQGKPLTIWHNSATLHNPRAEDFGNNGVSRNSGSALTAWAAFVLRPRNLFDSTPLYPQTTPVSKGKVIFSQKGQLAKTDKLDAVRKRCYCHVHDIKMTAGKIYTIDLTAGFDTYLRLENAAGKQLRSDDDSGRGRNSRIVYRAPEDGVYRIVVTSFVTATGGYELTVRE